MQHEQHRLPVTAVASSQRGLLLAGEGTYLSVYTREGRLLKRVQVFESQAVHGFVTDEAGSSPAFAWGGPLVRSLTLYFTEDGEFRVLLDDVQNVRDWILDAALSPVPHRQQRVALLTAHNALWTSSTKSSTPKEYNQLTPFECAAKGSNCILYSAHLKWLSASHCLIASGTVFGDIMVWSAFVSELDGRISSQAQLHYTFSAHEGSVFGVQITSPVTLPHTTSNKRVLASCSDDRNIKLWDISDLDTQGPSLAEVQRETGFSTEPSISTNAPPCLAKTMGHISRIWHVRFLADSERAPIKILSFGEDASMFEWALKANGTTSNLRLSLEKVKAVTAHSGKNVWAVAINEAGEIATGGADGAIAVHSQSRSAECTSEIPRPQLHNCEDNDNLRAYCSVDTAVLVSTTDHGRVVLIDSSHAESEATITEVSGPHPCLKGYSIVASLRGVAFIAGTDGAVFSYTHRIKHLCKVAAENRKVTGLFASEDLGHGIALLITTVGATTATLLQLEHNSKTDVLEIKATSKLSLAPDFVVTSFASRTVAGRSYANSRLTQ